MPPYLIETHDADELVAEDPFSGMGVFLPSAASGEETLARVGETFGTIPAVAFPHEGVWVAGLGSSEAKIRWGSP